MSPTLQYIKTLNLSQVLNRTYYPAITHIKEITVNLHKGPTEHISIQLGNKGYGELMYYLIPTNQIDYTTDQTTLDTIKQHGWFYYGEMTPQMAIGPF
jgi:hypothetical protein